MGVWKKLIDEPMSRVYQRIMENRTVSEDEARSTAAVVGLVPLAIRRGFVQSGCQGLCL